jgi:hypothetical protein
VCDLLNDQLVVGFTFFSLPENPVWMAFHVLDVVFGMLILFIRKGDREAGPYFLCVHKGLNLGVQNWKTVNSCNFMGHLLETIKNEFLKGFLAIVMPPKLFVNYTENRLGGATV